MARGLTSHLGGGRRGAADKLLRVGSGVRPVPSEAGREPRGLGSVGRAGACAQPCHAHPWLVRARSRVACRGSGPAVPAARAAGLRGFTCGVGGFPWRRSARPPTLRGRVPEALHPSRRGWAGLRCRLLPGEGARAACKPDANGRGAARLSRGGRDRGQVDACGVQPTANFSCNSWGERGGGREERETTGL